MRRPCLMERTELYLRDIGAGPGSSSVMVRLLTQTIYHLRDLRDKGITQDGHSLKYRHRPVQHVKHTEVLEINEKLP